MVAGLMPACLALAASMSIMYCGNEGLKVVKLTRVYGPDLMNRFNMFTSISVTGQPRAGYSSGDAIAAIERVAAQGGIDVDHVLRERRIEGGVCHLYLGAGVELHSPDPPGILRRHVCVELQPFRQNLPRDDAGGSRKPRKLVDVAAGAVLHLDFETVGGGVA